jgi:hypothetical protein
VSRPLRQGPHREPAYHEEPASLVGFVVGGNGRPTLLEPDGTIKRHVDRRISETVEGLVCVFSPSPISNHTSKLSIKWRSCSCLWLRRPFASQGPPQAGATVRQQHQVSLIQVCIVDARPAAPRLKQVQPRSRSAGLQLFFQVHQLLVADAASFKRQARCKGPRRLCADTGGFKLSEFVVLSSKHNA